MPEWEEWKEVEILSSDEYRYTIARGKIEDFEELFDVKYNNLRMRRLHPETNLGLRVGGSKIANKVLNKALEISSLSADHEGLVNVPVFYSDKRDHPILIMNKIDEYISIAPAVSEYSKLLCWQPKHFFEYMEEDNHDQ